MKQGNLFFETGRYSLVALFMYTATSKMIGYPLFLKQLQQLYIFEEMAVAVSMFIPAIEIITALLLLFRQTEITGWWFSGILLTMFSFYVAGMMLFAASLPCSCGGIIASLTWPQHLVLNIFLAAVCWFRLYRHYSKPKICMHT